MNARRWILGFALGSVSLAWAAQLSHGSAAPTGGDLRWCMRAHELWGALVPGGTDAIGIIAVWILCY